MQLALGRVYGRLGIHYFTLYAAFEVLLAGTIVLGTIGLLSIYEEMSPGEFWGVVAFAETCVATGLVWFFWRGNAILRPLIDWVRRGGGQDGALAAWQAAISQPRRLALFAGWQPFVIAAVPIAAFATLTLDLPFHSVAIVFAGALVAVAYAGVLDFFAAELFFRPVIADVARALPDDFTAEPAGVPLRWKLLGSLPLINVITGVVVSGLSTSGQASVDDLGLDVVVAVLVAFTLSFELTLLVSKSVLVPVRDLLAATERAGRGDLSARVPVVSGDELGTLATSFNRMLAGLEERERLRAAFDSYVDPEVAERVLEEGELLEGEELDATVMFVDVRDFTAFAETATARHAVAQLNDFFGLVVPIVARHGGHANKFVGDGLLAVFGAPERFPDHAARAVSAACEIADEVGRRYRGGLSIGVGINSGQVVAGSVGGGGRLEFTVIGDPVNVAARVEKATREVGDTVLVTEATRRLLPRDGVPLEARGAVALRGKSGPVPVYAPRSRAGASRYGASGEASRGSSSERAATTT